MKTSERSTHCPTLLVAAAALALTVVIGKPLPVFADQGGDIVVPSWCPRYRSI